MPLTNSVSFFIFCFDAAVLPLWQKMMLGMTAGAVASFVGNPCDLALVRMQSDALLPVDKRRNYTGIFNAVSRVIKEEGVLTLWRGSSPTVLRAIALNTALLASSDQIKEASLCRCAATW
jgi:solute carrier family 25 oxoglutarate transporter 11